MSWYFRVLYRYAVFRGRATRSEYWWFVLFHVIVTLVLALVEDANRLSDAYPPFTSIYSILVLTPGIAVTVRRLHDTDRSGWWALLELVPVAGLLVIFFLVQDSDEAANRFGPNPKSVAD